MKIFIIRFFFLGFSRSVLFCLAHRCFDVVSVFFLAVFSFLFDAAKMLHSLFVGCYCLGLFFVETAVEIF